MAEDIWNQKSYKKKTMIIKNNIGIIGIIQE